jgi:hypothetical protein
MQKHSLPILDGVNFTRFERAVNRRLGYAE